VIRFGFRDSSLGLVLVAMSEGGIRAIFLGDDQNELLQDLERRFPHARLMQGGDDVTAAASEVVAWIEDPRRSFDLPLDLHGTPFQLRVWKVLREIPFGKTTTYAAIAHAIGAPKAVRAVAQACGANPLAVVIPCHRVLRADGDISGYRWGIERKRKLLAREQQGLLSEACG